MNVLLISTVHPPNDPRIVHKIIPSLARKYNVFACLPHARPNPTGTRNISMIRLPHFRSLFYRLIFSHPLIIWKCLLLRPDVVHILVPELIPLALVFRWFGADVVYEVQENLYKKFSIKQYNNGWLYRAAFGYFDKIARKKFRLVLTEDAYLTEYRDLQFPAVVVHNYVSLPFIDQFYQESEPIRPPVFYYCGVISMERSFDTMVKAFALLAGKVPEFRVLFFGPIRFPVSEAENLPEYQKVKNHFEFYGYTDLRLTLKHATGCTAGIALLKPVADYADSYPTKLFEYMAMGLPVITSDFPLYREVVERSKSGFCISPYDPQMLADKLLWLIENPKDASLFGQNGKRAVKCDYNWTNEEKILFSFYNQIEVKRYL